MIREELAYGQWPESVGSPAARPFTRIAVEFDPATGRYHVPARGQAGARLPPGRAAAFEATEEPGRYRLQVSTGDPALKVTTRGTRTIIYKP